MTSSIVNNVRAMWYFLFNLPFCCPLGCFILPGIIKLTVSNTQNNLESVLKLQIFKQGYGKTTSCYITSNYMPQIACFKKTLFLNYSFNDKSLYLIFLYAKTGCFEKITIHCKFFCNFFYIFYPCQDFGSVFEIANVLLLHVFLYRS